MRAELDNKTYDQILRLSEEGEKQFNIANYSKAIELYQNALNLVPTPKNDWEASTWLNTAVGDSYFLIKRYREALKSFYDAHEAPGGNTNPFISLRIGECLFELDEVEKAEDYLLKAYMFDGKKIFSHENNKYHEHLASKYNL